MCQGDQDIGPDFVRKGPFDVCEVEPEPGQSPLVLNSMPGCQFHMTSYDDRDSRDDLDPAYGIHLHDPRMMEYMGAPESARLLGRSPEYWLEHMGRDRAVALALRLYHDASLIMTNVQVMAQFVTSLNRTASEVMRMVYGKEPFPTDAVQFDTGVRHITWQQWACGALPVVRCFLGQSRSPHAIPAWPARTAFQMPRSDELLLPRVPQWRCTYELKHCLSDILLRHSILQLRSVVIFDNFVVLVARFFWVLSHTCILLCNKSDRCI